MSTQGLEIRLHTQGKGNAEAEDDAIAGSLAEGWFRHVSGLAVEESRASNEYGGLILIDCAKA
jgi:hypothetical protein